MPRIGYEGFVNTRHKPAKSDLLCSFYMEPAQGVSPKAAAGAVAGESSVGTWTPVAGLRLSTAERIAATCYDIRKSQDGYWIKVSYPLDNFEIGSIPQIFSSIAGNIFGMKAVRNLRLEDVKFPEKMAKSFMGPQFGTKGIRKILGIKDRPITISVPKPVGMTTSEHVKIAHEIWHGGVDLINDDESLTNQPYNRFDRRVIQSLKVRDRVEKETGEKKSYLTNITAPYNEMVRRAKLVAALGGEYAMVDICTVGWSALQAIREICDDLCLAIHAHRAFHAAFTRNHKHGMSMLTVAKAARLAGVDQIHIGTVVGKLESPAEEVTEIHAQISQDKLKPNAKYRHLGQEWHRLKNVLSVCSGGLHPGLLPKLMSIVGNDIGIQCGGGIHGHPGGSRKGAMAVRQAIDAAMEGTPLPDYARNHKELAEALKLWGYLK